MDIPWELLGSGGAGAVAMALILVPLLRRKNGVQCPIPDHVEKLAQHGEAIGTLKEGHTKIFNRLDQLPQEIVLLMKEMKR